MQTEQIDKLYLELSQFSQAKTRREIELENLIRLINDQPSHEKTTAMSEYALANVENRKPEDWATECIK